MYAAFEETTAVAETLLRAMEFLGSRSRTLARPGDALTTRPPSYLPAG
jgi:hypothetical protein